MFVLSNVEFNEPILWSPNQNSACNISKAGPLEARALVAMRRCHCVALHLECVNMDAWKTELTRVFVNLFAHPESQTELIGLVVITLLGGILSISIVAKIFGMEAPSGLGVVVACCVTYALSLAAVIAVRLYYLSQTPPRDASMAMQVGAAVLVVLLLGVPLHCLLLKGNYLIGLLTFGTAIGLTSLVTIAVKGGWDAVVSSRAEIKNIKDRDRQIYSEMVETTPKSNSSNRTARLPRHVPSRLAPKKQFHP